MTIVKVQPNSPPPSPEQNANEMDYQNYYRPETPDVKPQIDERFDADKLRNQRAAPTAQIGFSISNILHPEFGLNAIRKTNKIEGPKPVGPNHSILYKPYDLSKQQNEYQKYSFDYLKSKEPSDFSRLPPLGGLRQTVSQIGEQKEKEVPKIVEAQKRPDSASSMVSSTSSGAPSTCGSTDTNSQMSQGNANLWPAWVYCTRYSDRPSSGKCYICIHSYEFKNNFVLVCGVFPFPSSAIAPLCISPLCTLFSCSLLYLVYISCYWLSLN